MAELDEPPRLRSGAAVLPNRIAKAAMEEQLAVRGQLPGDGLRTLYRRWATGRAGLLITGHVMVNRRAVAQPRDVVLVAGTDLRPFGEGWAGGRRAGLDADQPPRTGRPEGPDRRHLGAFREPRGNRAVLRDISGAAGHDSRRHRRHGGKVRGDGTRSAGGRLRRCPGPRRPRLPALAVPLAPGERGDAWGGSLANRARLLLDVVRGVRAEVGPGFAVAAKLIFADSQRGVFESEDAQVVNPAGRRRCRPGRAFRRRIESLATAGAPAHGRTLAREAYFLDLSQRLVAEAPVPLMLTGGVRRRAVAQHVLDSGFAVVGLATALAIDPDRPRK